MPDSQPTTLDWHPATLEEAQLVDEALDSPALRQLVNNELSLSPADLDNYRITYQLARSTGLQLTWDVAITVSGPDQATAALIRDGFANEITKAARRWENQEKLAKQERALRDRLAAFHRSDKRTAEYVLLKSRLRDIQMLESTAWPVSAIPLEKPAIYLYPVHKTEVSVQLSVDGAITRTDPQIDPVDGWQVIADPSGSLLDPATGRTYPYLFWEAESSARFDMSKGFVVRGVDTRAFLSDKLAHLGLDPAEVSAFLEYWLPRMEPNAYNLIHFEGPVYERAARLAVSPEPDMQIRVFIVFKPLAALVTVTPQRLQSPEPRRGFVLVEWGGAELSAR